MQSCSLSSACTGTRVPAVARLRRSSTETSAPATTAARSVESTGSMGDSRHSTRRSTEGGMGVELRGQLLTVRQRAIIEYLQRCEVQRQSPTVREIADACGISSTGMVNYHLRRLAEYGL